MRHGCPCASLRACGSVGVPGVGGAGWRGVGARGGRGLVPAGIMEVAGRSSGGRGRRETTQRQRGTRRPRPHAHLHTRPRWRPRWRPTCALPVPPPHPVPTHSSQPRPRAHTARCAGWQQDGPSSSAAPGPRGAGLRVGRQQRARLLPGLGGEQHRGSSAALHPRCCSTAAGEGRGQDWQPAVPGRLHSFIWGQGGCTHGQNQDPVGSMACP